jgi:hypothetical protein
MHSHAQTRFGVYAYLDPHRQFLGVSSSDEESKRVVEEFAAKWDLKEVDVALLLGLTVEKLDNGSISLSQTQYFEKVLAHFGYQDLPPLSMPFPPGYQIHASTSPLSAEDAAFMLDKPFRPILGTLVWGSSGTRPDISYLCCALGHVQTNPNPKHWSLLIGVLRYVKGTLDYGIRHSPCAAGDVRGGLGLKPEGYVDSDWAGCMDTRRSTSGYVFFMGGVRFAGPQNDNRSWRFQRRKRSISRSPGAPSKRCG